VIGTGLSYTLDQYLALSRGLREAIIVEANRMNRGR
jgi:hypothetical protein